MYNIIHPIILTLTTINVNIHSSQLKYMTFLYCYQKCVFLDFLLTPSLLNYLLLYKKEDKPELILYLLLNFTTAL